MSWSPAVGLDSQGRRRLAAPVCPERDSRSDRAGLPQPRPQLAAEVRELRAACNSERSPSLPKCTVFNGQSIDVRFQSKAEGKTSIASRLQVQASVAADFRFVRVESALGSESLGAGGSVDLTRGHSLFVDLGSPAMDDAGAHERRVCLLTPRVLLRTRESSPEDARTLSSADSD